MPNIELLEKSMPVAPIRIAALGCRNLQKKLTENLLNSVKSWLNATAQCYSPGIQRRIIYCRM